MNAKAAKDLIAKLDGMDFEALNDLAAELDMSRDERDRFARQYARFAGKPAQQAKIVADFKIRLGSWIVLSSYNED